MDGLVRDGEHLAHPLGRGQLALEFAHRLFEEVQLRRELELLLRAPPVHLGIAVDRAVRERERRRRPGCEEPLDQPGAGCDRLGRQIRRDGGLSSYTSSSASTHQHGMEDARFSVKSSRSSAFRFASCVLISTRSSLHKQCTYSDHLLGEVGQLCDVDTETLIAYPCHRQRRPARKGDVPGWIW